MAGISGRTLTVAVALLLLCAILTGCAAVAPFASALPGAAPANELDIRTSTQVRLEAGNFVTVRTNLVGSSKGFKLLGFITLYPATLDKAMNRLYAKAEAQEGHAQTLVHLIVEHSGIYVILFSIPKVTTRADLVEFVPERNDDQDSAPRNFGLHAVSDRGSKSHPSARKGF
jgi:hypothetical protein